MPNIDSIIDQLRVLSARMSPEDEEELRYIEQQSQLIGEIVGVYPPFSQYEELKKKREKKKMKKEENKRQKSAETFVLDSKEVLEVNYDKEHEKIGPPLAFPTELTFEEKRKLFEAKFPNSASAAKRARARERLNYIASNRVGHQPLLF